MRKALNDNPVVQIGALAALALLVGFLLITRMSHKSSESSTASTTTPSAASSTESSIAPGATSGTAASPSVSPTSAPPVTAGASAGATAGSFVAGPGLPAPVAQAYKADKVVVLLVVRRNGIDDDAVKSSVEHVAGPAVSLFVTNAGHIARYSRIAAGVNVDRVPALIVLRPRKLTHGSVPEASVSYGFRSADSVAQAIRDALYKGATNLPYYPK